MYTKSYTVFTKKIFGSEVLLVVLLFTRWQCSNSSDMVTHSALTRDKIHKK